MNTKINNLDNFRFSIWNRYSEAPVANKDNDPFSDRYIGSVNSLPIWDIDENCLLLSEVQTGLCLADISSFMFYLPALFDASTRSQEVKNFTRDVITIRMPDIKKFCNNNEISFILRWLENNPLLGAGVAF